MSSSQFAALGPHVVNTNPSGTLPTHRDRMAAAISKSLTKARHISLTSGSVEWAEPEGLEVITLMTDNGLITYQPRGSPPVLLEHIMPIIPHAEAERYCQKKYDEAYSLSETARCGVITFQEFTLIDMDSRLWDRALAVLSSIGFNGQVVPLKRATSQAEKNKGQKLYEEFAEAFGDYAWAGNKEAITRAAAQIIYIRAGGHGQWIMEEHINLLLSMYQQQYVTFEGLHAGCGTLVAPKSAEEFGNEFTSAAGQEKMWDRNPIVKVADLQILTSLSPIASFVLDVDPQRRDSRSQREYLAYLETATGYGVDGMSAEEPLVPVMSFYKEHGHPRIDEHYGPILVAMYGDHCPEPPWFIYPRK